MIQGWFGIVLIVIGIVFLSFGSLVTADPKRKENTWHYISIIGGLLLAIIGIIMTVIGFRGEHKKGYKTLLIPDSMVKDVQKSLKKFNSNNPFLKDQ
jgi:hypothetical protein